MLVQGTSRKMIHDDLHPSRLHHQAVLHPSKLHDLFSSSLYIAAQAGLYSFKENDASLFNFTFQIPNVYGK